MDFNEGEKVVLSEYGRGEILEGGWPNPEHEKGYPAVRALADNNIEMTFVEFWTQDRTWATVSYVFQGKDYTLKIPNHFLDKKSGEGGSRKKRKSGKKRKTKKHKKQKSRKHKSRRRHR